MPSCFSESHIAVHSAGNVRITLCCVYQFSQLCNLEAVFGFKASFWAKTKHCVKLIDVPLKLPLKYVFCKVEKSTRRSQSGVTPDKLSDYVIRDGHSLKEAIEKFNVPRNTASRWLQKYKRSHGITLDLRKSEVRIEYYCQ